MRFAYNTNGTANHRLADALRLIADAGYDGVALTLDVQHFDPLAPFLEHRAHALRADLEALHLGSIIETGARYLLDPRAKHEPTLVTPAAEGRAHRVAFLCAAIDTAAILGSECVSFWAGVPQPGVSRAQALTWLDDTLRAVLDHAEARRVVVAFEPEPGMAVETVADWAALHVKHPRLKLALDTGHCLVTQDIEPADAVRAYAPDLGTIAIEDMRRGDHTHLPFGEGDMDLHAVLRAVADAGFSGLVSVELSRDSHRAHTMVCQAMAAVRAALP